MPQEMYKGFRDGPSTGRIKKEVAYACGHTISYSVNKPRRSSLEVDRILDRLDGLKVFPCNKCQFEKEMNDGRQEA